MLSPKQRRTAPPQRRAHLRIRVSAMLIMLALIGAVPFPAQRLAAQSGDLPLHLAWLSDESDITTSVAWGDMDGDGDLDLAVGNYEQPTRVYRNDHGVLTAIWASAEVSRTLSVAWGDVDNDGDLDLAVGNGASFAISPTGQHNLLYRNDN